MYSLSSNISPSRLIDRFKLFIGNDPINSFFLLFASSIFSVIKGLVVISVITIISLALAYISYISLLPKALMHEPIYFDYTTSQPMARINLLANEKQWYYLNTVRDKHIKDLVDKDKEDSSTLGNNIYENHDNTKNIDASLKVEASKNERYLKNGALYSIDINFELAKSPRNYDINKFMLYTTLIDTSGDSLARSARPVSMPYQSVISQILQAIAYFPLRLIRITSDAEVSNVSIQVMNDYKEPAYSLPATEIVELVLSTSAVDIYAASLTLMPVLNGLTYYVYYYPRLYYFTTTFTLISVQVCMITLFLTVSWIIRYTSKFLRDSDSDVGSEYRYEGQSTSSVPAEEDAQSETYSPNPVVSPDSYSDGIDENDNGNDDNNNNDDSDNDHVAFDDDAIDSLYGDVGDDAIDVSDSIGLRRRNI